MEDDKIYPVGIVSRRTDLTARQLRYYESLGLVSPARRGNRRLYSETDILRLTMIRDRHEAGTRLEEIGRELPVNAPLEAATVLARSDQGGPPRRATSRDAADRESDLQATSLGRRPPPSLYPLRDRRDIEARMDRYERDHRMDPEPTQDPRRRIGKERSHDQSGRSGS